MKNKLIVMACALALVGFAALAQKAGAEDTSGQTMQVKGEYVHSLVGVLRTHAQAMRTLSHHHIKYSDNMVRHSLAMRQTFGMLGPMEWHAAKAAMLHKGSERGAAFDENSFMRLADDSLDTLKNLTRAAERWMRDGRADLINASIDNMMRGCNNCHALLPDGTAPHVWEGMVD